MSYGGSSGGSGRISTSGDVALSSPLNSQVLAYDSSLQKWKNQSLTSASMSLIKPEDYAQSGDSDDTASIQRALSAAPTNGVVTLTPGKNYVTSQTISVNSRTLYGVGASLGPGSGTALSLSGSKPSLIGLTVAAAGPVCVDIAGGTTYASIIGGTYSGGQVININATGVKHTLIQSAHISGTYGVLTNNNATDLQDLRIIGCVFDDISADCIELNHPNQTEGIGGSEVTIQGNHIHCRAASDTSGGAGGTTAGFGVGIAHAYRVSIVGNTFYDCRREGIHIEDTANMIVISGNTFKSCDTGIWALGGRNVTIQGNAFDGGTSAITMTYNSISSMTYVSVTGNTISQPTGTAVYFLADSPMNFAFTGNTIRNGGGTGLSMGGSAAGQTSNSAITANVITGCTGYGMSIQASQGLMVGMNVLTGNTQGPYNPAAGSSMPVVVRGIGNNSTIVPANNNRYTAWVPMFDIGVYASGQLTVSAVRWDGRTQQQTQVIQITWNGSALTQNTLRTLGGGPQVAVRVNTSTNKLEVQALADADGRSYDLNAHLDGIVLYGGG